MAGSADGLRLRAGLRVWTSVRTEDRRIAEIRATLGAERFDQAFASGPRLTRSEVVAAARRTGPG